MEKMIEAGRKLACFFWVLKNMKIPTFFRILFTWFSGGSDNILRDLTRIPWFYD